MPRKLACSRLSVSRDDRKAGAGRAGSGRVKKVGEGALSCFIYKIPLVPRPLFRSSPLTESLEQATRKLDLVCYLLCYQFFLETEGTMITASRAKYRGDLLHEVDQIEL